MAIATCHTQNWSPLISLQFWPSLPRAKINQHCDSEGRANPNIPFSRYKKSQSDLKIQKPQTMKSKCLVSAPRALIWPGLPH